MNTPPRDQSSVNRTKEKTAQLSVASNTILVILKFAVGFGIGSVSIISEAIHSSMDLIAAVIAFFSVKKSAEPPDHVHEFGHGKFEDASGLIEALLIFIAAILIIWEALNKLLWNQGESFTPDFLIWGIAVIGISALANWYVSHRLFIVAKESESIALESDAWHLRTDVYTSLGVFLGLILIRLTGIAIFDPLFALGVAVIILKAACDLAKRSLGDLMDQSMPESDEKRIREIICGHASTYAGFHDLKTRRSGPEVFIEFHLVMPGNETVTVSHDFTDHLESDLKLEYPRSTITIHVEPCSEGKCDRCGSFCTYPGKTGKEKTGEQVQE
ncbi:cation diffusion facilitator family transporter [Methanoregula boonei 6A8]|uniref:Cation diffusion facilitator family transporter n=1 Tax=Methanoregula boonei (strain DSM 21154 / JCM 14090 / 6A8) TaxID=456442 RepID=A7I5F3_METB6|nr:cation diffusion facilitator family transporter [Methanoregula boonei]ABS54964.1 cation diffusion facilitator family transporter [Methanoregula boonei 6A8]